MSTGNTTRDDLEDDRAPTVGDEPGSAQPARVVGGPALPALAVRGGPVGKQEDEARDAGRRDDEDGDLAEGVPHPDVDEGDVDDVVAPAVLVCRPSEVVADRRGGARVGGEQGVAADGQPGQAPDGNAHASGRGERSVGEEWWQAAHDEHERDDREGLDEHLSEGEVRGPVGDEQQRRPVPGDTEEQHGAQPSARAHGEDGGDDDDRDDGDLEEVVGPAHPHPLPGGHERDPGTTRGRAG